MQNYSFIKDKLIRYYIIDALAAIQNIDGAWEYLKNYNPEDKGYSFANHPIINKISTKMDCGHSGVSFGMTIRYVKYIIDLGYEGFKNLWNKTISNKDIIITI
jgi:hypothetical protein